MNEIPTASVNRPMAGAIAQLIHHHCVEDQVCTWDANHAQAVESLCTMIQLNIAQGKGPYMQDHGVVAYVDYHDMFRSCAEDSEEPMQFWWGSQSVAEEEDEGQVADYCIVSMMCQCSVVATGVVPFSIPI